MSFSAKFYDLDCSVTDDSIMLTQVDGASEMQTIFISAEQVESVKQILDAAAADLRRKKAGPNGKHSDN